MKRLWIGLVTAGLILAGATTAWAGTFKTPAEIYADLKGITVEEAYLEKSGGTCYGTLAQEAGRLDEFKANMLANRKAALQDRVVQGKLTEQQADLMLQNMEQRMSECSGTGSGACGALGKAMGGSGKSRGASGAGKSRGASGGGCPGYRQAAL